MSMTEEEVRRRLAGPGVPPAEEIDLPPVPVATAPAPQAAAVPAPRLFTPPDPLRERPAARAATVPDDNLQSQIRGQDTEENLRELFAFAENQGQEGVEGVLPGWLNLIVNGAFFGTGDELLGGLRGMIDPRITRQEGIEAARGTEEAFREEHPKTAFALEVLGGAATTAATLGAAGAVAGTGRVALGVARTVRSVRAARPLTRALLAGGVGGAVQGAGVAEGGVGPRLVGAAIGGGVGAIAGPALIGVGSGIRSLATRFASPTGRAAGQRAAREAAERALLADGVPIDVARRIAERAQQAGVPVTLMEVGAENVQALAGSVSRIPGPGMRTLQGGMTRRAEHQNTRVIEAVQKVLGVEAKDVVEDQAARITARSVAAQPAYDASYAAAEALGGVADDEVNRLFRTTKLFRDLYDDARNLWKLDDVKIPALFNEAGEQVGNPDLRALDWMKQALDDKIRLGGESGLARGTNQARLIRNRLNDMLDLVDEVVPEYKAARLEFKGSSDLIDAMERGRFEFLTEDPRRLQQIAAEMGADELAQSRLGMFDAIRRQVEERGDHLNALRVVFNSRAMRDRIRALSPTDEDFVEFVEAMDLEKLIIGSENTVMSNSLTAARQAADRNFVTETIAGALTSGNPTRNAVNVGVRAAARTLQGTSPSFADEMAAIMTAGIDDPADLARVLDLMQTGITRGQSAAVTGAAAGFGGATGGGAGRFLRGAAEQENENPLLRALEENR